MSMKNSDKADPLYAHLEIDVFPLCLSPITNWKTFYRGDGDV